MQLAHIYRFYLKTRINTPKDGMQVVNSRMK